MWKWLLSWTADSLINLDQDFSLKFWKFHHRNFKCLNLKNFTIARDWLIFLRPWNIHNLSWVIMLSLLLYILPTKYINLISNHIHTGPLHVAPSCGIVHYFPRTCCCRFLHFEPSYILYACQYCSWGNNKKESVKELYCIVTAYKGKNTDHFNEHESVSH